MAVPKHQPKPFVIPSPIDQTWIRQMVEAEIKLLYCVLEWGTSRHNRALAGPFRGETVKRALQEIQRINPKKKFTVTSAFYSRNLVVLPTDELQGALNEKKKTSSPKKKIPGKKAPRA